MILNILIGLVVAGIAAAAALAALYIKGMRELDRACRDVFNDREQRESATNVRVLEKWERNAHWQNVRRRAGGNK